MKRSTLLLLPALLFLSAFWIQGSGLTDNLHYTREGKAFWYAAERGGFEKYTGIPMSELPCQDCHQPADEDGNITLADGSVVAAADHEPSCADCHDEEMNVSADVCLPCHGRQSAEISLSNSPNETVAARFQDVHRNAGMTCIDCHPGEEIHPAGEGHFSMLQTGAAYASCEECHVGDRDPNAPAPPDTYSHTEHAETVECKACHTQTVMTCYNCHFETEVNAHQKRFYHPPMSGFIILANDERSNKVTTMSYQSVTYGDTTFYAMGPYTSHSITPEARGCDDCHATENVQNYMETGVVKFAYWDEETGTLQHTQGVLPVPPDFQNSVRMDFARFLGEDTDPVNKPRVPENWEFMEEGPDHAQMLFATELDADQMAALAADVGTSVAPEDEIVRGFRLEQNYPNPFNPTTTVEFHLDRPAEVSLKVYSLLGEEVLTVIPSRTLGFGAHRVTIDAADLASGIYLYKLESDGVQLSKSMTVVK